MKKIICLFFLISMLSAEWHGYCLLEVNPYVPQLHITMALAVVGMAGKSSYTSFAHEKSVVRSNTDGTKYIWEITKNDSAEPTLEYVRSGIISYTPLTTEQVEAMITGLTVFWDAGAARNYIVNHTEEWNWE